MNPEHAETMARIRAARAYANLSQPDLADAIGMSLPTYKRAELGNRPVSTAELLSIARACEVPPSFLTGGFSAQRPERRTVDAEDITGRLDIIDERLDAFEVMARRTFEALEALMLTFPVSDTSGITN